MLSPQTKRSVSLTFTTYVFFSKVRVRLNFTRFFIRYCDVLFIENIFYRPFVLFVVLILAYESRIEWLYFLNSGNFLERNYFNEERVQIKTKYYEKNVGIGQGFIGIIKPEIKFDNCIIVKTAQKPKIAVNAYKLFWTTN